MSLNSALNPDVVKTALDKVFYQKFNLPNTPGLATAQDASLFMQGTTDRAAEIVESFSGVGYWDQRAEEGDVLEGSPRVANQKTFSVTNFAKSVKVPKNFFDDEKHSVITNMISDLGNKGRLTRDKNAFAPYRLGFTTALTSDGAALFSDSHTLIGGGTQDNKLTAALSESSLNAAFIALAEMKQQDGTLGGYMPKTLFVPPALFKLAKEITKSAARSGTANNDLNFYSDIYPGLEVKQSPFIGASQGGSDTAWFLLSDVHSIGRWVRQDIVTDMVDYKYSSNNSYVYKAEYREVVGAIDFGGAIGSTGLV